jgi:hypothetical protein
VKSNLDTDHILGSMTAWALNHTRHAWPPPQILPLVDEIGWHHQMILVSKNIVLAVTFLSDTKFGISKARCVHSRRGSTANLAS